MASSSRVQLVAPLKPSREAIQQMGIKLTEVKGNANKFNATLPQGWCYVSVNGNISTEITIFDDKRRARLHCTKVKANSLAYAKHETRVYKRYSIQVMNRHDNHPDGDYEVVLCKIEQAFENQVPRLIDDIVFSAGRTRFEPQYDNISNSYSSSHAAVRTCIQHADLNYPGWEKTDTYWD